MSYRSLNGAHSHYARARTSWGVGIDESLCCVVLVRVSRSWSAFFYLVLCIFVTCIYPSVIFGACLSSSFPASNLCASVYFTRVGRSEMPSAADRIGRKVVAAEQKHVRLGGLEIGRLACAFDVSPILVACCLYATRTQFRLLQIYPVHWDMTLFNFLSPC